MRRKIFLSFVAVILTAMSAHAYGFQSGDLYYKITSDSTVEVTYQYYMSAPNYPSLTSAIIPSSVTINGNTYSVTSIGSNAFYQCSSLTAITIPNSVISIGEDAFGRCSGLTAITIPNSVTSIEGSAFFMCSGLTSITIPNSVTSIGYSAFAGCSSFTSITIGTGVTSIGYYAFDTNSSLTSIVVEDGNQYYDSRNNCNALIETASNALILGCSTTIIPNSVTSIEEGAFLRCTTLTDLNIGDSVEYIGEDAFYGCTGLTSVTIPNSVKYIDASSFAKCTNLDTLYLGEQIDTILWNAFYECRNLRTIYSYSINPPCIYGETFATYNAHVYVPCESKSSYMDDGIWGMFKYIECIEEETDIESVDSESIEHHVRKILRDGNVYIIRDGKEYSILGQKL